MKRRSRGAALAVVLVLTAAGMVLSSAVATSAALELAMAEQSTARQRAFEAAEAGLGAALRARDWTADGAWSAAGELVAGGEWRVEVRLAAAQVDPLTGAVEWHFEIESSGNLGTAAVTLVQGFRVAGALPGEPRPTWWRREDAAP
ncbi:MAG: PilX N-terminal domain-containing pilus assembly protein [Gammaproteobacteria bacterium]